MNETEASAKSDRAEGAPIAPLPVISVLMVTLCQTERRDVLLRAVESIVSQEGVNATPVIVVNGNRYDPSLLAALKRRQDVRVIYQEKPSIFFARRLARESIDSPYFAMIDDDDEFLPNGLKTLLDSLRMDPQAATAVGNGLVVAPDGITPAHTDVDAIRRDPIASLMERNWLATAGGLFRTEAVTPDYFNTTLQTNDLTYLAFRLALEKRIVFVEEMTFRKTYSPDSISLTDDWNLRALGTLKIMLDRPMPTRVRRLLRIKVGRTLHGFSEYHRRRREPGPAWRMHLRSLVEPSGFRRYGLYTRKLLAASLVTLFR